MDSHLLYIPVKMGPAQKHMLWPNPACGEKKALVGRGITEMSVRIQCSENLSLQMEQNKYRMVTGILDDQSKDDGGETQNRHYSESYVYILEWLNSLEW